ncbi:hypothetical protein F5Y12DRAFT_798443 [Xylaria sp. FL1777]|nr:hypothetical protein F5Y12DRAFT_798443 [Xylaria sp. FL1777]
MFMLSVLISLLAFTIAAPTPTFNETDYSPNANCPGPGIIPVKSVGCWNEKLPNGPLDFGEFTNASLKLQAWGRKKHIGAGSFTGAWICNCKHFHTEHVVPAEMEEAQRRVQDACGGHGGWLWSSKWQKSYNFGSAAKMTQHTHGHYSDRCPKYCLWWPASF